MKTTLLAADHPTVLRRLVRELNHRPDGFYTNGHRYNKARVRHGSLQIKAHGSAWTAMGFSNFFSDGSGNQICAGRTP